MKRMLFALSLMAVVALSAGAALAQYPGPDALCVFPTGDAAEPVYSMDVPGVFVTWTVTVCICNPSEGYVGGFEGTIRVAGPTAAITDAMINGNVDFGETTDNGDGTIDVGFRIGIGELPLAVAPNAYGVVPMASISGYSTADTEPINFYARDYHLDIIEAVPGWPSYAGATAGDIAPLYPPTGGFDVPCFVINGEMTNPAPEAKSWGAVKALF